MSQEVKQTLEESLTKATQGMEENDENLQGDSNENDEGDTEASGNSEDDSDEDSDEDNEDSDDNEEESDEEDDATRELRETGFELAKLLSNPETRERALAQIAKDAGFELKTATKQEQKDFKRKLSDVLSEALGDEYSFLPVGFSDALENVLNSLLDERVKPLETKILEAERAAVAATLQADIEWAYTNLDGFQAREKEILAKMEIFPKSPKISNREYLQSLYTLAGTVKGSPVKSSDRKTDKSGRLQIPGGTERTPLKDPAPKNQNIDDALFNAARKLGIR